MLEERTARLEAENVEIRTHFATKADLERGLRLQTGVLLGALVITVGVMLAVLGQAQSRPLTIGQGKN
jgi:hypothetical protein